MSEEIYIDDNNYEFPEEDPESFKKGFAITCFVLSIFSVLCCCCGFSAILAPLSIVFGVIALVKKQGGKGLSIAGIIISAIAIIASVIMFAALAKVYPDMLYFVNNDSRIIAEFEEDGTIPEQYEKYREPEYDKYWTSMGYDNFDAFFADFIRGYKQQNDVSAIGGSSESSQKSSSDDGEELVSIV